MARTKTRYVCQSCGSAQPKWQGRCPDCGEWNTLVETLIQEPRPGRSATGSADAVAPVALPDIPADGYERIPVPIGELSRVLGGGIVPGSVVLISGDPGIGKSTLLIQLCTVLAGTADRGGPVLYVSGEESAAQIKLRAERLGVVSSNVLVLADTHLESIMAHIERAQPRLVVVDSVQSIYSDAIASGAGRAGARLFASSTVRGPPAARSVAGSCGESSGSRASAAAGRSGAESGSGLSILSTSGSNSWIAAFNASARDRLIADVAPSALRSSVNRASAV